MKGLRKRRRLQILGLTGACLLGVLALLWALPDDAFQYFRAPAEVAANPPAAQELFRIGGLVENGSLLQGEGTTITFRVTDGAASIPVSYTGILPALFAEGQGMVGQGRYINGTFEAVEILARHDENYMPAEVIEALEAQGVYRPTN